MDFTCNTAKMFSFGPNPTIEKKPGPLLLVTLCRNLKPENSQDMYCPETSTKVYVHEFHLRCGFVYPFNPLPHERRSKSVCLTCPVLHLFLNYKSPFKLIDNIFISSKSSAQPPSLLTFSEWRSVWSCSTFQRKHSLAFFIIYVPFSLNCNSAF